MVLTLALSERSESMSYPATKCSQTTVPPCDFAIEIFHELDDLSAKPLIVFG